MPKATTIFAMQSCPPGKVECPRCTYWNSDLAQECGMCRGLLPNKQGAFKFGLNTDFFYYIFVPGELKAENLDERADPEEFIEFSKKCLELLTHLHKK